MPGNRNSLLPLVIVGLFLAAHVVVPLVWGDLYPFTSAPMFRDKPERYCDYHVFGPDGTELPQEDWLVQRVYDGNPVGYGVGVAPPAVIEQQFGAVDEEQVVRRHILERFKRLPAAPPIVFVDQRIFGPRRDGTIGLVDANSWRVQRPTR
jgi:hypothetical protein